jgi:hypothetical protein
MRVDFPGKMIPFGQMDVGQFFVFFDEQDQPNFAMPIFRSIATGISQDRAEGQVAVLSFSTPVHATYTPPTVLHAAQFQNRDVLVLPDAQFRPGFGIAQLRRGLPSLNYPGPVIFAEGHTFVRAWHDNRTIDVDVDTGAAIDARRAGGAWVEDWTIILNIGSTECVLCARGKPAASG